MPKILRGTILTDGRQDLIQEIAGRVDEHGCRFAYLVPTAQLQQQIKTALVQHRSKMQQEQGGGGDLALPDPYIYLFDGFVNEILKDWWEYQPPIQSYQQRMILKRVTEELDQAGKLPLLKGMMRYDGFYTTLIQWLKEVKKTGKTPEEWQQLHHQRTQEKEGQLGLIYERYEEFLATHDLVDEEANYNQVIQGISNPEQSSTIIDQLELVIIDGFFKLSQLQLRLVKSLIQRGKDLWVHLTLDEERKAIFLSSTELVDELQKMAKTENWDWQFAEVTTPLNDRMPTLAHLSQNLFNLTAQPLAGSGDLQILHLPDPYQEMEQIGRMIKQALLADQALQLDQVGVILRNVEDYHHYIDQTFQELGIPYKISLGVKLSKTPIFKLILKIYNLFLEEWSRESLLEIIKSPYLRIAKPEQIEAFEHLLLEAGVIRGQRQALNRLKRFGVGLRKELWWQLERWNQDLGIDREEFFTDAFPLEKIRPVIATIQDREGQQKVQRLLTKLTQLEEFTQVLVPLFADLARLTKKQSLREHGQALLDFFATYQLDRQVIELPTEEHDLLRRDLVSLERVQSVLQEMIDFSVTLAGGEVEPNETQQISYQELLTYLKEAAAEVHMPEPQIEVGGVQILTPSQSRGRRFKQVYVGGLAEGQFPYYGQNDWLFKQEEREALKKQGIRFRQFYERIEEERLFFLEAVSTATQQLILTCPGWQADERVMTSSFIEEVLQLFTPDSILHQDLLVHSAQELTMPLTERELDESYLKERWLAREMAGSEVAATAEPGCDLRHLPPAKQQELAELYHRGSVVQYREGVEFSPYDGVLASEEIQQELAKRYHHQRVYSITELNSYATCPFQFYGNRILQLEQAEEPTMRLEPLDQGNLYHQVLYRFFNDFPGWEELPLAGALERITEIARAEMTDYLPGENLPADLWALYQEELLENLHWIIRFEYQEAEKQGYEMRPVHLEASFGQLKESYREADSLNIAEPVILRRKRSDDTSDEVAIRFKGKIDRIDLSQDGQYVIIYDYKFGSRDGLSDVQDGIDLQLPIYVKAAQLLCGHDKEVLGAGYFSLVKGDRTKGIWRDARKELVPLGSRSRSYLTDEDWQELLDQVDEYVLNYLDGIRRGDFRVSPAKCPDYCKFKKICRYDQTRIRLKQSGDTAQEDAEVGGGTDEL